MPPGRDGGLRGASPGPGQSIRNGPGRSPGRPPGAALGSCLSRAGTGRPLTAPGRPRPRPDPLRRRSGRRPAAGAGNWPPNLAPGDPSEAWVSGESLAPENGRNARAVFADASGNRCFLSGAVAGKWPTFSAEFGEPGAPKSGKLWRRIMAARTVCEVEVLPAPGMPVVKCAGEKCAEGGGAQIGPVVGNELASRRRGRSRCHVLWGCRWRNAPPAKARTAAARRSARGRPPGLIF